MCSVLTRAKEPAASFGHPPHHVVTSTRYEVIQVGINSLEEDATYVQDINAAICPNEQPHMHARSNGHACASTIPLSAGLRPYKENPVHLNHLQ
jgi:hypothetical protein